MTAKIPRLFHYETIGSTNDEALLLAEKFSPPYFVTANHQTAGRGRMGRVWHSPEGNLYCTAVFSVPIPLNKLPLFTLYAALNVCDTLHKQTGADLWLKWPNDLWIGHLKCAGFLAESPVLKNGRLLLLGFGLNVNTVNFPEELANTATSLKLQTEKNWPLPLIRKLLCQTVTEAYSEFLKNRFDHKLSVLWKKYERLEGQEIQFEEGGVIFSGIVEGLKRDGSLKVRCESKSHALRSGEVTLSKFLRK